SVQGVRQREDQMEVWDGQECGCLLFQPIFGPRGLTGWTVTVAATVRYEVLASTGGASEQLAAQRAGAAGGQRTDCFPLMRGQAQRRSLGLLQDAAQQLPQSGAGCHGSLRLALTNPAIAAGS